MPRPLIPPAALSRLASAGPPADPIAPAVVAADVDKSTGLIAVAACWPTQDGRFSLAAEAVFTEEGALEAIHAWAPRVLAAGLSLGDVLDLDRIEGVDEFQYLGARQTKRDAPLLAAAIRGDRVRVDDPELIDELGAAVLEGGSTRAVGLLVKCCSWAFRVAAEISIGQPTGGQLAGTR